MVTKIQFTNKGKKPLKIIIEPEAVNIELESNCSMTIELNQITAEEHGSFCDWVLKDDTIILYESHLVEMKLLIDGELKYKSL